MCDDQCSNLSRGKLLKIKILEIKVEVPINAGTSGFGRTCGVQQRAKRADVWLFMFVYGLLLLCLFSCCLFLVDLFGPKGQKSDSLGCLLRKIPVRLGIRVSNATNIGYVCLKDMYNI